MFISAVAIRRPVFTAMIIVAMVVFGLVSLRGLGVDLIPKVDFPLVSIVTQLPGADPETVESRVTDPIEEAVNTLSGIRTLHSTSAEGYSSVAVEFQLEKDINVAYQEVQARVNSVRSQLPTDDEELRAIAKRLVADGLYSPRTSTATIVESLRKRIAEIKMKRAIDEP